jgi:xylulokinase
MGVWDNQNGGWWRRLFEAAGVEETVFGTVRNSGCETGIILPSIAEVTRIPTGTRVFTGGHDYLCAAFAAACADNQSIVNVTGTYEIMASFHDMPWQRDISNTDPIRPLVDHYVLPNKFSYQLESFGAGQTEWLRKNIFNADTATWNELFLQLETRDTLGNFIARELYIPHLQGQIVPAVNMDATGVFIGLTETTDRVTLLKAVIEGLCFKTREMLEAQRKVTTMHPAVKMVGGGSKSRVWIQAKANILNTPVFVPRIREATALGAAMLAGVGAGIYSSYVDAMDIIAKLGVDIFEPQPDFAARYDEIFYDKYQRVIEFLTSITK